jgi:hypothetical protein
MRCRSCRSGELMAATLLKAFRGAKRPDTIETTLDISSLTLTQRKLETWLFNWSDNTAQPSDCEDYVNTTNAAAPGYGPGGSTSSTNSAV